MKPIRILAIESSCDETAAAVIEERPINDVDARESGSRIESGITVPVVLSNVISSQVDLHALTGGVVPEVASRAHMEAIGPVIAQALEVHSGNRSAENCELRTANYQQAIELLADVTHIAVTAGPGLIGSLLVGFNAAKTLAYARDLPIVPINHIEGHVYSTFSREFPISNFQFPILSLTVSGGHTSIILMKDHGVYEMVGSTIDDAVGEAYDKVAKLLGLGYPGGPALSKLASKFRKKSEFQISNVKTNSKFQNENDKKNQSFNSQLSTLNITFPRPILNDGTFNFSLSGLKTAVLVKTKQIMVAANLDDPSQIDTETKEEIAAAFEEAVAEVLVTKMIRAIEKYNPKTVVFAGGVSANSYLRESLEFRVESLERGIKFLTPTSGLFGDNAAMIGLAAYYHIKRGDVKKWNEIHVDANLKLV